MRVTATTLEATDPLNHLNVPADPVVLYHDLLGQIVILVPAPAPDFITESYFGSGIPCFDIDECGMVPSYFYRKNPEYAGWDKVA